MSNERFENVWDALEQSPADAENFKIRAELMMAIKDIMRREGWTQGEAAQQMSVTQPRISDLVRGKIDLFGLDTLVTLAVAAGLHVEICVKDAA